MLNNRRRLLRNGGALVLSAAVALACQRKPAAPVPAPVPETPEACRARQTAFIDFVSALPDKAVATPTHVDLPTSTLGAVPGPGRLVELGANELSIEGVPVAEPTAGARATKLAEWVEGWEKDASTARPGAVSGKSSGRILYVAASGELDVRKIRSYLSRVPASVELRLLVRPPPSQPLAPGGEGTAEARELAGKVLGEPRFERRRALATAGYARFSDCPAVTKAVSEADALDGERRWPTLRAKLREGLPSCDCGKLDTASLRLLVSAEQRAGAQAMGWIPLSFLRDERCEASMPLRSLKKLVGQMEQFDQQFSGGWQKDALAFENVLTSERLGVYFCDALPGETLAAKQSARATVYLRVGGTERCDAWAFEPLAMGSPYGTIRRASTGDSPPLAFHYRQAAEEIRLLGPAEARSRATDDREWPCDEVLRMTGVDETSIALDKGRWFFTEAACRKAKEDASAQSGCFSARAAGIEPPPPDGARGKGAKDRP